MAVLALVNERAGRSWEDLVLGVVGAGAIAVLHPATRPLMLLLAFGCGMTRLLSGAHWLSDVYVGAVVGLASAAWLWTHVHDGPSSDGRTSASSRTMVVAKTPRAS